MNRRLPLLALILLLHMVLLSMLMRQRKAPTQPAATSAGISVQLIVPLTAQPKRPRSTPAKPVALPAQAALSASPAETLPSTRTSTVITLYPPPPSPAASTPDTPAKLNLQLPTQIATPPLSPAQAATRDPRGNSHRPDVGERMAQALGSDPSKVETITGDGKRRVRQGASCLDLQQARIAQIDPFSENSRNTPAQAKSCDK